MSSSTVLESGELRMPGASEVLSQWIGAKNIDSRQLDWAEGEMANLGATDFARFTESMAGVLETVLAPGSFHPGAMKLVVYLGRHDEQMGEWAVGVFQGWIESGQNSLKKWGLQGLEIMTRDKQMRVELTAWQTLYDLVASEVVDIEKELFS